MTTLDDATKQKIARWIDEGLKLAEIQKRMIDELGITMTYMEARFLMDDLRLIPRDPVPPKEAPKPEAAPAPAPAEQTATPEAQPAAAPGKVSVSLDELPVSGSVMSGKVTFSDGQTASWYLDQMGRLGMAPAITGYRPSQEDIQSFQAALESELAKGGY